MDQYPQHIRDGGDRDDDSSNPSAISDEGFHKEATDDKLSGSRKRNYRAAETELDNDDKDDKKNRGNYRCGRCNLPKKGHVCPYQPVLKPRERGVISRRDAEAQADIDPDMTIACLGPLHLQGMPESYQEVYPKVRRILAIPS